MTETTGAFGDFSTVDSSWIDTLEAIDPKAFLLGFFKEQVRSDGRTFGKVRPTTIVKGVLKKNTVGSALVKLQGAGSSTTQVLVGVTLQIGQPAAATPLEGDLRVTIVQPQSTSSIQQQQQQGSYSCLQSWLQQVLVTSGMVDLAELSLLPGRAAWRCQVTVVILNGAGGNLYDAALLAAVAALCDTRLPTVQSKPSMVSSASSSSSTQQMEIVSDGPTMALPICKDRLPIPLTMAVYQQQDDDNKIHLLADPTTQEQHVLQGALVAMVVSPSRDVLHVHYASHVGLGHDELALCAHMAYGRAEEMVPLLLSPLS